MLLAVHSGLIKKRKPSINVLKEALLFRALVLSDTFLCVSVPVHACVCEFI